TEEGGHRLLGRRANLPQGSDSFHAGKPVLFSQGSDYAGHPGPGRRTHNRCLGRRGLVYPRGKIGRAHAELQSRGHIVCRLLLEKKKNRRGGHGTSIRSRNIRGTPSSSVRWRSSVSTCDYTTYP